MLFNYYLIVDELMDMIDDLKEKINKLETEVMDLNVGLKENEQNMSQISENVHMNKVTQLPTPLSTEHFSLKNEEYGQIIWKCILEL